MSIKDCSEAHRKAAEHDERPKACELLDPGQLKVVEVNQPKSRPEKSLTRLPEAENGSYCIGQVAGPYLPFCFCIFLKSKGPNFQFEEFCLIKVGIHSHTATSQWTQISLVHLKKSRKNVPLKVGLQEWN